MKKLGTIVVSLLLAWVVVYLGAGTVVVECMMNNTVSVGTSDDGSCKDDGCCKKNKPCMKTTVVKLQPTLLCKSLKSVQIPIITLIPQLCGNANERSFWVQTAQRVLRVVDSPHAPPRLYLAVIRVLII